MVQATLESGDRNEADSAPLATIERQAARARRTACAVLRVLHSLRRSRALLCLFPLMRVTSTTFRRAPARSRPRRLDLMLAVSDTHAQRNHHQPATAQPSFSVHCIRAAIPLPLLAVLCAYRWTRAGCRSLFTSSVGRALQPHVASCVGRCHPAWPPLDLDQRWPQLRQLAPAHMHACCESGEPLLPPLLPTASSPGHHIRTKRTGDLKARQNTRQSK